MFSSAALLGYGISGVVVLLGVMLLGIARYYGLRAAPVSLPVFGLAGVIAVGTFAFSLLIVTAPTP